MNFQRAVDRDADLASPSTLCRFENRVNQGMLWEMNVAMVDVFIESFDRAPEELILDFDSTDDAVHGQQAGRFFHVYYDHYCFLPLHVFCGDHLLAAYLRPSNKDGEVMYAAETWNHKRRIIVKAEHSARGQNPRFAATNLPGDPDTIYDQVGCARGKAENRIKEQQLCLFADRASCMNCLPNQFRVLLSARPIHWRNRYGEWRFAGRSRPGPGAMPAV